MKTHLLFPNKFKAIGWVLFALGFILGAAYLYWEFRIPGFGFKMRETGNLLKSSYENFTNELALMLVVSGLLITAFSKEKVEDELIAKIRANSLYWAVLVGFAARLVYLLIDNTAYFQINDYIYRAFHIIAGCQFFIPLLIFKIRFQYLINRNGEIYAVDNLYYLPTKPYRFIAIILSILLIGIGIYCVYTFLDHPNFLDTIANFMSLPLIAWVYTREANEDEFITSLRLQSMQLAVCGYYCLLLIANLLLYGISFLFVINLSIEIIAIIFLISFNFQLNRYKMVKRGLAS